MRRKIGDCPYLPRHHAAAVRWARVLADALTRDYAAEDFGRVARYASRWETPHFDGWCAAMGFCAVSLETPYAMAGEKVLLRADYQEIGRRLARTLQHELR